MRKQYTHLKDYIDYARDYRKQNGSHIGHMGYDEFEFLCIKEEDEESLELERHIRSMKDQRRYV